MVLPLFVDHNPFHPHVPISKSIETEVIEVHKVWRLDNKHAPSPPLIESPSAAKKTNKKNQTLNMAAPSATSTAVASPPPFDIPLDDGPLMNILAPLLFGDLMVEGSGDLSEGTVFTSLIALLGE